jgi:hypothetical protein
VQNRKVGLAGRMLDYFLFLNGTKESEKKRQTDKRENLERKA